MTTTVTDSIEKMTGKEIVDLTKKHTLFEWSAQSKVDPIPVAKAKGIYFWTPEGKRFIDFNSQLMSVNIGHGDERVIAAIHEQAQTLAYANPFMATEPRARLGAKLAEITPGDIDTFFFTNGGAEANENAIKLARFFTGRHKIMARYRSYHGATAGAISLDRRSASVGCRAGHSGRGARARSLSRHRARMGIGGDFAGHDRRDDAARRSADDRGIHSRDGGRNQRHSHSSRWVHAGRAQAVRQVRHSDDRGRSHGWLRAHGRVVCHRSLEGRA